MLFQTYNGECALGGNFSDNSERVEIRFDRDWRFHNLWQESCFGNQTIFDFDFDRDENVWILTSQYLYRYNGYQIESVLDLSNDPNINLHHLLITLKNEIVLGGESGLCSFINGSLAPLNDSFVKNDRIVSFEKKSGGVCLIYGGSGLITDRNGEWIHEPIQADSLDANVQAWHQDRVQRLWALTDRGLFQWDRSEWINPWKIAKFPGSDLPCQAIVESEKYGLIVVTEGRYVFVLREDRWEQYLLPETIEGRLLVTGDNEILLSVVHPDQSVSIRQWSGTQFEPVSAQYPMNRSYTIEEIREAPDSSIWLGGYRCLLRWERKKNDWVEYANVPPPRAYDIFQQKIWFADDRQMFVYNTANEEWRLEPNDSLKNYAVFETGPNEEQTAIGWEELRRAASIQYIHQSIWDASGYLHIIGRDELGKVWHACRKREEWAVQPLPMLNDIDTVYLTPDRQEGIWIVHRDPLFSHSPRMPINEQIVFLRVRSNGVESVKLLTLLDSIPTFSYTKENGQFMGQNAKQSYEERDLFILPFRSGNGVFFDIGFPFNPIDRFACLYQNQWIEWPALESASVDIPGSTFRDVKQGVTCVEGERSLVFAFGKTDAAPGSIGQLRDGEWREWIVDTEESAFVKRLRNNSILISARDGFYWLNDDDVDRPFFCTLPVRGIITDAVEEPNGTLWLYVRHGVFGDRLLRYRRDGIPPDTQIVADRDELSKEETLNVKIVAVEKFGALDHWKRFQYSWRLDGGSWCDWSDSPTVRFNYADLAWGKHSIEAKTRDQGLDVDPEPNRFEFAVVSLPLQERDWFVPVVLSIFSILSVLSVLLLISRFQLFRHNVDLEKRVKERTEELRKTEKHILSVSEREQQRIGQELHDGVVQDLAGMSFLGDLLVDTLQETAPTTAKQADRLISMLKHTRDDLRVLAKGLAPVTIERDGLVSALQDLAKKVRTVYRIHCYVDCNTDLTLPTQQIALNLYRIAQEAVYNAAKHARPKSIQVRIRKEEKRLRLDVIDDGMGISPSGGEKEGMGIAIMTFRAERIGAEFSIAAREEGGTRVSCALNVDN